MSAPLPSDERTRLKSLHAHEILDTLPETAWDNIVKLASHICQVPISAISFVDQDRQWFKAITGLDAQETDRDVAFCAHTILTDDGLVVPDAQDDPRFQDNPLVTAEPHIRFYAGYPIHGVNGSVLGALCVIDQAPRALTPDQQEAMRALTQQTEQLLRLHAQEAQLKQAADGFQVISEKQKTVLSNISHEMRTPLNAISGYVHLLGHTGLNEKQMQYMHTIQEASDLLLKMVNNILDFAKIEAGKMSLEHQPLSLHSLCQNLYHILHLQAQQKNLDLKVEVDTNLPQTVQGDPLKLQQVLLNLLNNAIKFTETGQVTLQVSALPAEDNATIVCRFEVADTGPGIALQDQGLLFEAFQQLHIPQESTGTKGTGLGLTISRDLVDMMGGQLQVDSTLGEGSRFYFTLPFACATEKPVEALAPLGLRILALDDQEDTLHLLDHYLSTWQCTVTTARTPTEAKGYYQDALAHNTPFDVLIIDWKMPEQDGLDFIAALQEIPAHPFPFVLLVTAYASDLLTAAHILSTTHGVLSKPVSPLELHEKLHALMTGQNTSPLPVKTHLSGKQVLVVDDEPLNRHLMQDILQQYEVKVRCVASGFEALSVLQEETTPPDLIFMDFHMPLMNGIETTQKIRALPAFQKVPIIALSANVLARTQQDFLQVGGSDFLAKPIQPQALQNMLARYLQAAPRAEAPQLKSLNAEDQAVYDKLQPLWQTGLLDWDSVYERVLGKSQLLWQLLEQFYAKTGHQRSEIQSLLASPSKALQERLHALKGNASNLSLKPLFQATRDLEQNLPEFPATAPLSATQVEAFTTALDQTLAALAEIFDRNAEGSMGARAANGLDNDALDTEALQTAFDRLDQTLARYDVDAIDEISGWCERVPQSLQDPVLRLKGAIAQFDYATARQQLEDLRALL